MDGKMFDELTARMAQTRPTRRLVAAGLFGATVTALTAVIPGAEVLAGNRKQNRNRKPRTYACNEDSCDGTGGKECGREGCYCYRHRGGHACVDGLITANSKRCRKDRHCPGRQVCVKSGPACGDGRGFCKRLCTRR